MLSIENLFEKGEKAFTISDQTGEFRVLEVEIYGFVYQDFEKDKPAQLLYVFDIEQGKVKGRKFGNPDIMFKTREDAMVKLQSMLPEYEKGFTEEMENAKQNVQNLEDHKNKLMASAKALLEPAVATDAATEEVKPLPNEQ
jgi:hypothetical protein